MQRAWKRIKKDSYLIVFVLPGLVVLGVRFGGAAAYLTPFVAFVPVYWGVLATVVHGAIAGGWTLAEHAGNTWSMGILSGIGIVVAHELGHESAKLEKRLAKALLHPTFYGHFTQEHDLGHRLMVSTPEDPSSTRFGESFRGFYPRTVAGTFRKDLELERQRLARVGRSAWSLANETWRNVLFPVALTGAAYAAGELLAPEAPGLLGLGAGATAALVVVVQAVLGVSLLEIVNDLQPYGLERRKLPNVASSTSASARPARRPSRGRGSSRTGWPPRPRAISPVVENARECF